MICGWYMVIYHKTNSVSGHCDWLPERAKRDYALCPARKFFLKPMINHLLTKLVTVTVSFHTDTQKRELGQCPAV